MKIDIVELAKKAGAKKTYYRFSGNVSYTMLSGDIERFAALHRQALIDSGELVPREQVEKEREFSKQLCMKVGKL